MPLDAKRQTPHAVRKLVPLLLSWFSSNARDLPWRRTRDPYAIWVSEIMLQQTQVKTVIPYWERWMRELPTIQAVAKASPAKLHKLWEGLGYYTRVRNLQKAAQQIVAEHNGKFPENFADILALPGIGRYTAGAIASIAFDQPCPILDGNVIRVLTRLFGIRENPREKKTNARLWLLATELVKVASEQKKNVHDERRLMLLPLLGERAGVRAVVHPKTRSACSQLNQSLMELGALICTPRQPQCDACPVNQHCLARRRSWQEKLPNLGQRQTATARRFIAFVAERGGKFLVRQRPAGVVNAHLWEFPNLEAPDSTMPRNLARTLFGRAPTKLEPLATIRHSITRYRITLEAYRAELPDNLTEPAGQWLTHRQLQKLAFTSAHKKILAWIESERRAPTRRVSKLSPTTSRVGDRRS